MPYWYHQGMKLALSTKDVKCFQQLYNFPEEQFAIDGFQV